MSVSAEEALVRRMVRHASLDRSVRVGPGDDCAVLAGPQGRRLLFASDMLVEGVHFSPGARPEAVGWKAMAVNVSDVAAMGGVPRHAVVSVGLPRRVRPSVAAGLAAGLGRCARRFGVSWVGGDTVRCDRLVVGAAILGEVESGRCVTRAGARPGDVLFVTGRLGGAVQSGRHLRFRPRLREARAITARFRPHAMIDLSDGLLADLTRLCGASRVGARVQAEAVPRSRGAGWEAALTEGEDFELLLAVPAGQADRLERWAKRGLTCRLTRIGRVTARGRGGPVRWLDAGGRERAVTRGSFEHFR